MEGVNKSKNNLNMDIEAENMSVFKRITGVIFSPTETFKYLEQKPTVLVPIIIMILVSIGSFFIMKEPIMDAIKEQTYKALEMQGVDITQQLIDQSTKIALYASGIGMALGQVIMWFVGTTFLYWIIRIMKGQKGLKKYLSITGYSSIIMTIGTIIFAIYTSYTGVFSQQTVVTSLASLLDKSMYGTFLYGIAASLELFNIWTAAIIAIGITYVSKLNKTKVYAVIIILYIIYSLYLGYGQVKYSELYM